MNTNVINVTHKHIQRELTPSVRLGFHHVGDIKDVLLITLGVNATL